MDIRRQRRQTYSFGEAPMKTIAIKSSPAKLDPATKEIMAALRRARSVAIKTARMHGTPIIYQSKGKLIREHP